MINKQLILCIATFFTTLHSFAEVVDGSYLTTYKGGISTPHIKLAKPYAMGKPNVLFLLSRDEGQAQEAKELSQRADLNCQVFCFTRPNEIGAWGHYYDKADGVTPQLKEQLLVKMLSKKYDVIVIGSISFAAFPPSCKYLLMKAFKSGTGLVINRYRGEYKRFWRKTQLNGNGSNYILHNLSFKPPKAKDFVQCYQTDNSRLVAIDDHKKRNYWLNKSTLFTDSTHQSLLSKLTARNHIDLLSSVIIRAIYWSAKLTPQASISNIPENTINENIPLHITYTKSAPKTGYSLQCQIVNNLGRETYAENISLTNQQETVSLKLPQTASTNDFIYIWLKNAQNAVEDWAILRLNKPPTNTLKLSLDKVFYEKNESIQGTINTSSDSNIKVSLIDYWNRDISSTIIKPENGKATFTLPLNNTKSLRILVKSEHLTPPNQQAITETFVSQMRDDEYMVAMWPVSHNMDLTALNNYTTLSKTFGLNSVISNNVNWSLVNMTDSKRWHWIGRQLHDVDGPKAQAKLKELEASAKTAKKRSRRTHIVGDEVNVDCILNKNNQSKWQKWLKKQYHTIAILNSVWGTSYPSFSTIPSFTPKDVKKDAIENFPRYLALKRFCQINTANFLGKVKNITQTNSPKTLTGLQYLSLFNKDAEFFAQNMDLISTPFPTDPTLKLMRDLSSSKAVYGGWTGGYFNQRKDSRRLIWTNLLNGCNSIWLFIEAGGEGMLGNDGRVAEHCVNVIPDYQELARGIGSFILKAKRLHSKVAILHDFKCALAAQQFDKLSKYKESHQVFDRILNEAGIQYHYIGGRELASGILMKNRYKTLILPFSTSISQKQVQAIKQFVSNGGTLICDVAPGVLNRFGQKEPKGMLAQVLGVDQDIATEPIEGPVTSSISISLPFGIGTTAKATSAKSFGKVGNTPAFFKNQYGRGTAWLLNFTPFSFLDLAEVGESANCAKAFRQLVNVKPLLRFETETGSPLPGIELFNIFKYGGRYLIGFIPDQNISKQQQPQIILRKKWHITNSLTGEYLGFKKIISLGDITKHQPYLFSLSPEQITHFKVTFSTPPQKGKTCIINIQLLKRATGKDVITYQLLAPNGIPCPWFDGSLTLTKGKSQLKLPIADNEEPGQYKLVLKDVLSRHTASATYTIK